MFKFSLIFCWFRKLIKGDYYRNGWSRRGRSNEFDNDAVKALVESHLELSRKWLIDSKLLGQRDKTIIKLSR